MSDNETKDEPNPEDEKNFWVDRAKTGRAACKKCKQKLETGGLRIAKMGYNPFGAGKLKQWHHIDCILEVFKKQRPTTAKIDKVDDMGGWDDLTPDDQEEILSRFPESLRESNQNRDVPDRPEPSGKPDKKAKTPKKKPKKSSDHDSQDDDGPSTSKKSKVESKSSDKKSSKEKPSNPESERDAKLREKDNSFREFRKLCAEIADIASYTSKTEAVKEFFDKGSGKGRSPY